MPMIENQAEITDKPPHQAFKLVRSWSRFSLRTCLLCMTVLCLVLGFIFGRAREQQRAVLAVEHAYGHVMYDYHRTKTGKFDTHAPLPFPASLAPESWLHALHSAVFLDLDSPVVTNKTLQELRGLRNLEVLHISNTSVTNEGLAVLKALPALRTLTINTAGVNNDALKHLADLRKLENLQLSQAAITDAGLAHLNRLQTLRTLFLDETQVTAAGVERLQQALPACRIDH